jgi:hypothetical protein
MKSTYIISSDGPHWSVFVCHDDGMQRLQSDLPNEASALKSALAHARATGRHFDMKVCRVLEDGTFRTIYDTQQAPAS